ncbi:MAG: U32 family peptidase [Bacteroidales bacterium]|nr:U32 family peptidase [Bacteroidales bacterium]
MTTPIELLAPAKDLECGIAAINHGADAVYVGAPAFSARVSAANTLEDIEQLCRHAHLYHAHVHVALNTILTDSELEQARKIIYKLYEAGADALIIQDMGLLQIDLPPIALHASTQTDNRTLDKVLFWEKMGLQRAILARELSLEQIRNIRKHTNIELEAFVHGALCVSYSGQCYMSQACTGRSANRGNCAQFCRLPYTLTDADGKVIRENSHLLSLKDMNRADSLEELLRAGITSLKIEGRLKSIDYVKNITAFYRQKLDAIFKKDAKYGPASAGKVELTFTPDPQKTFNRGATEYFLHGRENVMVEPDTPKSIGEPIGKILNINGNKIRIATKQTLHNGDGLSYVDENHELAGFRINTADGGLVTTLEPVRVLKEGDSVYRNLDIVFDKQLRGQSAVRRIPVDIHLSETDEGFLLRITDEEGVSAELAVSATKEEARQAEAANENLRRNLAKLGGTPFVAREVTLDLTRAYFLAASVVNQWRREVVERLVEARLASHQRPAGRLPQQRCEATMPLPTAGNADYRANIMNRQAEAFYQQHGASETAPAYEEIPTPNADLMTCKHCIRFTLGFCTRNGKALPYPEPLFLTNSVHRFQLEFDCKNCEMKVKEAPSLTKTQS